jgi:hypothetical protein
LVPLRVATILAAAVSQHAQQLDIVLLEQRQHPIVELARVPQIALGEITRRGLGVGLFDKPFDREEAWSERRAGADVAVLGRRARRLDAEHDDPILLGGGAAEGADLGERRRIGDDMVGGKRDDDSAIAWSNCPDSAATSSTHPLYLGWHHAWLSVAEDRAGANPFELQHLAPSDPRSDQRLHLFSRRAIDRIAIESGAVSCYWMKLLVKAHRRAGDWRSVGACSSGKEGSRFRVLNRARPISAGL